MAAERVDVSGLLELRRMQRPDRPDAVGRIVNRFLEESEERLVALQQAVAHEDPANLERAAHALKGIAGTVGANEIFELAVRLEQIGHEGHVRGAAELMTELGAAFTHARPVFEQLARTAPTP